MDESRVSVIIPAYSAAATICRAVDSVLAQTVAPHEVIVVDDGSPDDLAHVVTRTYGERVILLRRSNGGVSTARNAGIERATGNFVAFLDADDYWEPEKLACQLAVFERHPEVQLVAGRFFNQASDGTRSEWQNPRRELCDRVLCVNGPAAFANGTVVWTGTVIVRREALGAERFDTTFKVGDDVDMWVRLIAGRPMYFLSTPLAAYVFTTGSLSRASIDRECRDLLDVVARHRRLLGLLAARQWSARLWFHMSVGAPSRLAAVGRLLKSLLIWPLPLTSQIMPSTAPPRWRRLAVLLVGRGIARTSP
jgi:glycosyltransferase involved in cell wall biosynthesis